jgi:hypothetical protein
MIRLTLLDQDGKAIAPQDMSVADLREAAELARALIRECERLVEQKSPKRSGTGPVGVPYLS